MAELNQRTLAVRALRRLQQRITSADYDPDRAEIELDLQTLQRALDRFTQCQDALIASA